MTIDSKTVEAFVQHCQKEVPGFNYKSKAESRFMRWLAALVSLFVPTFMTSFTTTIGKTVYFPYDPLKNAYGAFHVLTHEFIHAYDAKRNPLFGLLYLFPIVLMPLFWVAHVAVTLHWASALLLGAVVLYGGLALLGERVTKYAALPLAGAAVLAGLTVGFVYTKWWGFLLLGSLACLAPLPAPFRTWAELRGYAMSLCVQKWLYPHLEPGVPDFYIKQFTGPNYYFMFPFEGYVTRRLLELYEQGQSAEPPPGFKHVRDFIDVSA